MPRQINSMSLVKGGQQDWIHKTIKCVSSPVAFCDLFGVRHCLFKGDNSMVAHHRGNTLLFVFSLPLLCKSSELFKTWWVPGSMLFVCNGLSHLKIFWWSQESDETLFPHFQLSWLSICSSGLEKQLSKYCIWKNWQSPRLSWSKC